MRSVPFLNTVLPDCGFSQVLGVAFPNFVDTLHRPKLSTAPWEVQHTTMGMAGQRYPGFEGIAEPRLASFITFSSTVPMVGSAQRAFERLSRPLLSITGTRDSDVVGVGATPEKRKAVFAALPSGNKAHLVLIDADHMTFAGQVGSAAEIVPRESITRELQAEHHARVAAIHH